MNFNVDTIFILCFSVKSDALLMLHQGGDNVLYINLIGFGFL